MTKINDGGPAYPARPKPDPNNPLRAIHQDGMSLRDWFAGRATEDDIRAHTNQIDNVNDFGTHADCTREQAKYRYADAMLAERERGQ